MLMPSSVLSSEYLQTISCWAILLWLPTQHRRNSQRECRKAQRQQMKNAPFECTLAGAVAVAEISSCADLLLLDLSRGLTYGLKGAGPASASRAPDGPALL